MGESPFCLTYGMKAILPIEMVLPIIQTQHFSEENLEVGL